MGKTTSTLYLDVDNKEAARRLADFEKQGGKIGNTFSVAGDKIDKAFDINRNKIDAIRRAIGGLNDDVNKLGINFNSAKNSVFGVSAALGISEFIDISKKAIEISKESAKANRLLASSATEIGVTYGVLAEKNKKFAELNALALTDAARTTAQIARLAGGTGKPQNFDRYSTAFSDLSAARGIDARQQEALIGNILSGQDEGLNKLSIADPGELYKAYARQLGTTADKLTQFQKAQAAANAVVEKSEIFKGAAEARLQSFEGRAATLDARIGNLTTSLSNSATRSYEFNTALDASSKFVQNLTRDVDELQRKLALGIKPTDKDFSDAAKPSFLSEQASSVGRGFFRFMSGFSEVLDIASIGSFRRPLGLGTGFKDTADRFAEASVNLDPQVQQQYREDFIRQQYHAQLRLNALQKTAAEDQQKYYKELEKKDAEREKSLARQSELQRVLSNPYTTLSELRDNRDRLRRGDLFGKDDALTNTDKQKLADDFDKAVSQGMAKGFSRTLQSSNDDLGKLRQSLNQVLSSSELLPNDREELVFSYERQIKSLTEKLRDLRTDLSNFTIDSFAEQTNNSFIKPLYEMNTAFDRMEKRYKSFGAEAVNLTAQLEKANIGKKISLLAYESDSRALTSEQNAIRTSRIRDNELGGFQRALETVEKKVDFALKINQLNRDISETDFYARNYNPNNPKSFEDTQRRFFGDDPNIRNSLSDVKSLRGIDTMNTGVLGAGAVANSLLQTIPPLNQLISALSNPRLAGDARYLLGQRSGALQDVRASETQKLNDFIYDQQTKGLNQRFANEQLNLLNQSGLTGLDRAKRSVDILSPLGTDISAQQRAELLQSQISVREEERRQRDNADRYLKNISDTIGGLDKKLSAVISANGLKVEGTVALDEDSKQSNGNVDITIRDETGKSTGSAGSQRDVAVNYNLIEGLHNSFGDGW